MLCNSKCPPFATLVINQITEHYKGFEGYFAEVFLSGSIQFILLEVETIGFLYDRILDDE
jgi:hypothetical protein